MKSIAQAQGVRDAQQALALPQPPRDGEHERDREVGRRVGEHARRVREADAAAADGLDVDVVVADRDVGHDPQLLAGGVEERVVDAVVQHHDDRVRPADRGVELLRRERPVLLGDPDVGAGLAQRGERRLGQAAGDDDPGHAAGL